MYYLTCDVCKKMIKNPVIGFTHIAVKNNHVCRKCKLAYDRDMQDKFESEKTPYDFIRNKERYVSEITAKCSK